MSSPTSAGRLTLADGLLLVLCSAILFSGSMTDIDSWWHINSGRWIWTHQGLPSGDPMLMYPEINHWGQTILRGQWGGQLMLFLAFEGLGPAGVILLRAFVLAAALALLAWRLARTEAHWFARSVAVVAGAVVLSGFAGDRPQLFSILFFSLLMVVFDLAEKQRARQLLILPLLVVWTNVHQGVLLGAAVSVVHLLVTAWLDHRHGRRRDALQSGCIALGALLSPLATPNGLNGIEYLVWLEALPAKARISEYASSLSYLPQIAYLPHLLVFFLFAPLLALSLFAQIRHRPLQCVLPAALLVVGMQTYRYLPFAVILGMPMLLSHWTVTLRKATLGRLLGMGLALLIAVALMRMIVLRLPLMTEEAISPSVWPVDLSQGARAMGATGKIFSTVGWGGFLAWHLQDSRPFIDGRYLMDPRRLEAYTHMLWATPLGIRLFEQAGFNWVLIPYRNPIAQQDRPYGLIDYLRSRPEWTLQMSSGQGVLFSRNTPD